MHCGRRFRLHHQAGGCGPAAVADAGLAALNRSLHIDAALATEELETDLLLEALYQRFGFDFRAYERMALKRKLHALMQTRELATVSELQDRMLHDPDAGAALLLALSVQPAVLFDDPQQ